MESIQTRRTNSGFNRPCRTSHCTGRHKAGDCEFSVMFQAIPSEALIDKRQTIAYIIHMKYLNWDPRKNDILKQERGISFEEIAYLIESAQIIGIEENPRRSNQKIYILEIENYAVVVPFVENDYEIFLKTAFPSRKYAKRYDLRRK